jgi:hypothetical protein
MDIIPRSYPLRGHRSITVYCFLLRRNKDTVKMPVISAPYVRRFVAQFFRLPAAPQADSGEGEALVGETRTEIKASV